MDGPRIERVKIQPAASEAGSAAAAGPDHR
jgi:hypothetical protein